MSAETSQIFLDSFLETVKIILMVILLMIVIEFLELKYKDKIREKITARPVNQYVISSLLGAVPGCMDAFFIVSLYVHGVVGFGALTAVMLSTAGDEAYIMLTMIPEYALIIFAICAVLGVIGGFLTDQIVKRINLKTCQPCEIEFHDEEKPLSVKHFFKEHFFRHVVKKHLPKLFLWVFLTLLAIGILKQYFDLEGLFKFLPPWFLIIIAALIGIIPESGPHLVFVILFSNGIIPFSVLLVNTLSQDGHGLLPLLSYSVKDTIYVQIFTTLFALIVGGILFFLGI